MIYWISEQKTPLTFTTATLSDVCNWIEDKDVVAADTETTGRHPHYNKVLLLIVGDAEHQYVIDCRTVDVAKFLESNQHKVWIFHNASFDFKMILESIGVQLNNIFCTMIAYQVIVNGLVRKGLTKKGKLTWMRYRANLATLVEMRFHVKLNKNVTQTFIDMPDTQDFNVQQVQYAAEDVMHLGELRDQILVRARSQKLLETLRIEMELVPVLCRMELKGIDMDTERWKELQKRAEKRHQWCELLMDRELRRLGKKNINFKGGRFNRKRVHNVSHQVNAFGGTDVIQSDNSGNVNYGSPQQIQEIYTRAGTPVMSGDRRTTDEPALQQFLINRTNPKMDKFTNYLLWHRMFEHRIGTYGLGFLQFINKVTGRIHTRYTQTFTDTGRLSSGDMKDDQDKPLKYYVNFQNIPKHGAYRACFTVPSADYRYITYDLSGAELAILASNSQDPLLLAAQNDGLDIHSLLATGSYRIVTGDPHFEVSSTVHSNLRQIHKSVTFGIAYGAGAQRVAEILNVDKATATEVLAGIYRKLPKMKQYLDKVKRQAKHKLVVTANERSGRKRYFTAGYAVEMPWKVEKEGCNMPIQSTNADMLKEALIETDAKLKDMDAWMVNTVHDEISVVAHKDCAEQAAKILAGTMVETANRYLDGVTMKVDGKTKQYWTK